MLTYDTLQKQLSYNQFTGFFKWRVTKYGVTIGSIAGGFTSDGYISITIDNMPYQAHRLAWFYVHGYMPENMIDHKDRIRHHNWILNLREATNQCNQRNTGNRKNNTSGVKGVAKAGDKWVSQIAINSKNKYLGIYKEFDEAVCARLMGEQCLDWEGCDSHSPAYLYVQNMLKDGNCSIQNL